MLISILMISFFASAHAGHHHGAQTHEAKTLEAPDLQKQAFERIQARYVANVQPIFETKCASCHSASAPMPWYAGIPGLHQLIEGDRTEAKEHLEISKGFPFAGHGEPIEDLKAIEETAEKNTMPPGLFSLMHPSLRLTDEDKRKIIDWARGSQTELGSLPRSRTEQ